MWAKPVVSPAITRTPGTAVTTAGDLLDATVVERRRRRALVLGVDLGELATGPHGGRQHPFQHVVVDHPGHATGGPIGEPGPAGQRRAPLSCPAVAVSTGLRGEAELVVGDADTARSLRSGTVDVLATPRLLALCEEASCRAIASALDAGTTSVGMRVGLDHVQPSGIGERVVAEAVLAKVEGRRLTFTVSASDGRGLVAVGKVQRVIVDVERFMGKCGAAPDPVG